jgi:DUF2934 family protein
VTRRIGAGPTQKQGVFLVAQRRCRSGKQHEMEDPIGMEIVGRAYELWEQAGMPEGMEQEFYRQAEQELRDADKSAPDDLWPRALESRDFPRTLDS